MKDDSGLIAGGGSNCSLSLGNRSSKRCPYCCASACSAAFRMASRKASPSCGALPGVLPEAVVELRASFARISTKSANNKITSRRIISGLGALGSIAPPAPVVYEEFRLLSSPTQ